MREIRQVLTVKDNKKKINDYFIFINRDRGDNIKIVFKSNKDDDCFALKSIFSGLQNFISEFPSPVEVVQFPLNSLFLNFENNTIFSYPIADFAFWVDENTRQMHSSLSEIILEVFNENLVDSELIISLFLYLSTIALMPKYHQLIYKKIKFKDAEKIFSLKDGDCAESQSGIAKFFEDNQEIFHEIFLEISQPYSGQQLWIERWRNLCYLYVQNSSDESASFVYLFQTICEHLGLNFEINDFINSTKNLIAKYLNA
jgi:hypothetical protein